MRIREWIAVMGSAVIAACAVTPSTQVPMPVIAAQTERQSDTLLILLPGRGDRAEAFRDNGFFDIARGRGFDMIAADAHFGYYAERSMVGRLHEDVVLPARDRGYRRIWILGVSMGGLGASLYSRAHPDEIDGLILLAPYPGDRDLVAEILDAGGLDHWPGTGSAGQDYQRDLWQWLKTVTAAPRRPTIVLGHGESDRFAAVGRILGPRLEPGRQFTTAGGHRWAVWRILWDDISAAGFPG